MFFFFYSVTDVISNVAKYNTSVKIYLSKITDFKNYLKITKYTKKLLNYSNVSKCNSLLYTYAHITKENREIARHTHTHTHTHITKEHSNTATHTHTHTHLNYTFILT